MDALILAGGVAKGAFAAGVLRVLLDPALNPAPPRFGRIVAASSGALNGAYLASAIHRGRPERAGAELESLWLEHATASKTFDVQAARMAALEGIVERELLRLMRRAIRPARGRDPVVLELVVTTMRGELRPGDAPPATTYEHVLRFDGRTFESDPKLEELYAGVAASAAFPIAFLPAEVRIQGERVLCFDGGITNNCPVRHAIGDPNVARVFVITPYPRVASPSSDDVRGTGLLAHLGEMLIHERVYRDIREARAVNRALERLELEVPTAHARERILDAIGWRGRRRVELVELRPPAALPGHAFEALFSRELRETYVRAGQDAARAYLAHGSAAA